MQYRLIRPHIFATSTHCTELPFAVVTFTHITHLTLR